MSGPLRVSPAGLRNIANALVALKQVQAEHRVLIGGYGTQEITHTAEDGTETVLRVMWTGDDYVIDDRIGD